MNRAFSAGGFWNNESWGAAPGLIFEAAPSALFHCEPSGNAPGKSISKEKR
jgi:hypothetical protein